MESEAIQSFIELAQQNSLYIATLNAEMAMIKWFLGVNIVAWIGVVVSTVWKRNNNKGK